MTPHRRFSLGARVLLGVLAAMALAAGMGAGAARAGHGKPSTLYLDGKPLQVHWTDGDTFRPADRSVHLRARIAAFNALESYGPVHQWGKWKPSELYAIAKEATKAARAGTWHCHTVAGEGGKPKADQYGRVLVRCPDLAEALVRQGLAHAFFFSRDAVDESLLTAQHEAQAAGRGMWAKGVPRKLVTSVHSADEHPGDSRWKPYIRYADTRTGMAGLIEHEQTFAPCTMVCPPEVDSCMLYVPYAHRYGRTKAACLRPASK